MTAAPKADRISGGVAAAEPHDSARKHVTGRAVYIDDMPEPAGTLHGCLGLSAVGNVARDGRGPDNGSSR